MRCAAALALLALSGCLIVSETPEDGTSDSADDGPDDTGAVSLEGPDVDTGDDNDDVPPLDETDIDDLFDDDTDDDTDDGTDDGGLRGCEGNVLSDPGFESGTPNDAWDEGSEAFGTPICDAECSEDPEAVPHSGEWWVWFGGLEDPDNAFVSQSFVVDAEAAALGFWLAVNTGAGTGDDVFAATIDGETVYMATDFDTDTLGGYTLIVVDVSEWADGAEHELVFESSVTGEALTNFFLDEVTIAPCEDPIGTTDGGSTSDTTAGSGSGSGSGSDTSGTASGSSGGSSSGSSGTAGSSSST